MDLEAAVGMGPRFFFLTVTHFIQVSDSHEQAARRRTYMIQHTSL